MLLVWCVLCREVCVCSCVAVWVSVYLSVYLCREVSVCVCVWRYGCLFTCLSTCVGRFLCQWVCRRHVSLFIYYNWREELCSYILLLTRTLSVCVCVFVGHSVWVCVISHLAVSKAQTTSTVSRLHVIFSGL